MKPELKKEFDDIADAAINSMKQLSILVLEVEEECDRRAIRTMLTDLAWIAENCTVCGLHQIGQAKEDRMGM